MNPYYLSLSLKGCFLFHLIRILSRQRPVILLSEQSQRIARGKADKRGDENKDEGECSIYKKPEDVVNDPVGRGPQAHHPHHHTQLHLHEEGKDGAVFVSVCQKER